MANCSMNSKSRYAACGSRGACENDRSSKIESQAPKKLRNGGALARHFLTVPTKGPTIYSEPLVALYALHRILKGVTATPDERRALGQKNSLSLSHSILFLFILLLLCKLRASSRPHSIKVCTMPCTLFFGSSGECRQITDDSSSELAHFFFDESRAIVRSVQDVKT